MKRAPDTLVVVHDQDKRAVRIVGSQALRRARYGEADEPASAVFPIIAWPPSDHSCFHGLSPLFSPKRKCLPSSNCLKPSVARSRRWTGPASFLKLAMPCPILLQACSMRPKSSSSAASAAAAARRTRSPTSTNALVPSGQCRGTAQIKDQDRCHETDMEAASMTGQITLKSLQNRSPRSIRCAVTTVTVPRTSLDRRSLIPDNESPTARDGDDLPGPNPPMGPTHMTQTGFYGHRVGQFLHMEHAPPSLITRSLRNAEVAVTETRNDNPVSGLSGALTA